MHTLLLLTSILLFQIAAIAQTDTPKIIQKILENKLTKHDFARYGEFVFNIDSTIDDAIDSHYKLFS